MSFWDFAPEEPAGADLHSLISAADPDYEAILLHNELLRTFVANDNNLLNFLLAPSNFSSITNVMLTHANLKVSKVVAELFVAKDSPLLKKLISDSASSEDLIKSIEKDDFVRIGTVSRIFQKAADTPSLKDEFIKLFNNSIPILAVLTKFVHNTAVYDLVNKFLLLLKQEDQWLIFSFLQLLLPKGKSANCPKCYLKYKDSIVGLIKALSLIPLNSSQKVNLIRIFINIFEQEKLSDVVTAVGPFLGAVYDANSTSREIQLLILSLALNLPPERDLLNISARLIQKANEYDQLTIAALNLLAKSPSKTLLSLLPNIVNSFVSDKSNTFHHLCFIDFIRKAVAIPELKTDLTSRLPPLIVENAQSSKWRENANRVAVFLEIAEIIDKEMPADISEEWKKFRENELKKWRTKDEAVLINNAPPPVAASSKKPDTQPVDFVAFSIQNETTKNTKPEKEEKEEEEKPPSFDFPDMSKNKNEAENDGNTEKVEFSFPEMPAFPSTVGDEVGGEGKIAFPDTFPPIEKENEVEEKVSFDFPNMENTNDESNTENNDNGFKFPSTDEVSFPPIEDEPEKVSFGDNTPQNSSQTPFSNFNNNNNNVFSLPKKQENQSNDTKSGDTSFEHFMELVNNPCWEYNGPSPEELFGQKDRFASADEAFTFLINQS